MDTCINPGLKFCHMGITKVEVSGRLVRVLWTELGKNKQNQTLMDWLIIDSQLNVRMAALGRAEHLPWKQKWFFKSNLGVWLD